MKKLFIISGPNGAGKTTASYTILPEILNCKEFVNADEIARGLSPFQPEKVSFESGRIMLKRIRELLEDEETFAFETTLASRSFVKFIERAQIKKYHCTLLFFWLNSEELAIRRVKTRVAEGGHNIPTNVIKRRYQRGLSNFFNLYQEKVDSWMLIDNSGAPYKVIAKKEEFEIKVLKSDLWSKLKDKYEK